MALVLHVCECELNPWVGDWKDYSWPASFVRLSNRFRVDLDKVKARNNDNYTELPRAADSSGMCISDHRHRCAMRRVIIERRTNTNVILSYTCRVPLNCLCVVPWCDRLIVGFVWQGARPMSDRTLLYSEGMSEIVRWCGISMDATKEQRCQNRQSSVVVAMLSDTSKLWSNVRTFVVPTVHWELDSNN